MSLCVYCRLCSTAGAGEVAAVTAGVIRPVLYPGLADKIHKLLGFKFCKFSPDTTWPEARGGGGGLNVPEK